MADQWFGEQPPPYPGPARPTKSVLSLDDDGVRGLSTLFILEAIMQNLNHKRELRDLPRTKPCEVFDLICGTGFAGWANNISILRWLD